DQLAFLVPLAGADGDHLRLDRLLLGGVGDEEAPGGLGLLIEALHQNSIVQRTDLHEPLPVGLRGRFYRHPAGAWQPLRASANKRLIILLITVPCGATPEPWPASMQRTATRW